MTGLALRPLLAADAASAAALHARSLPGTVNSQLGPAHLQWLYLMLLRDPASLAVGAWRAGALAGVVTATLEVHALSTRLMAALSPAHKLRLGVRLLARPRLLAQWWAGRRVSRPVEFQGRLVRPCLTAIAVAPEARRAGVGRALVEAVDAFVRGHAPAYHLDTRCDNHVARAFYGRLGFVEVEQRGPDVILVRVLTDEPS